MTLQLNLITWLCFFGILLLWAFSGMLAGDQRTRSILNWRSIFVSLFGFAWIYFGVIYIFRFFALLYDPLLFNATQFPMWEIPNHILSKTFVYLGVYWCIFCLGMIATKKIFARRLPKFLKRLTPLEAPGNFSTYDLLTSICTISNLLVNSSWYLVPNALLTPVGIIGSLWVIPPSIVWYLHFRGFRISLKRRILYLIPGIILFVLSPFREHLLKVVLCLLIPFLLTKPRVRMVRVFGLISLFLFISSMSIYIYRPFYWGGQSFKEASRYADWKQWQEKPYLAPWVRIINRFPGFDASALTVLLVPSFFPYENRNIVTELITTAFIPRMINWEKANMERGRDFSTSIWAYTEKGQILNRESAPIAPSMFGDLWASGGWKIVILGAFIWGGLVGFLECWRRVLSPGAAVALTVFLATQVGGGMERDFVHAASTIIQGVIVLLIFLSIVRRRIVWSSPRQRFG